LRLRQYYAHPRNQFWMLLGSALGEDLLGRGYGERLKRLKRRGIALWDVLGSCRRRGSLDSAIRDERPNPVLALVRKRRIKTVLCNGGKAYSAFLKHHGAFKRIEGSRLCRLPSSSPANASLDFAKKLARWRRALSFLAST
jgi:TDG/mug DNA glycosylase family protein